MSRAGAVAVRADLEAAASPHALLCFLTVTHPGLTDPIRVVSDVLDYVVDGATYTGVPFTFRLLTDSEAAPRTQLVISNVDRRIGQALDRTRLRATVRCEVRSSADFDLSVVPRVELVANAPIYAFRDFGLANVEADVMQISGDVVLHDYGVEPFPSTRATQDRFPALFR